MEKFLYKWLPFALFMAIWITIGVILPILVVRSV